MAFDKKIYLDQAFLFIHFEINYNAIPPQFALFYIFFAFTAPKLAPLTYQTAAAFRCIKRNEKENLWIRFHHEKMKA